MNFSMLKCVFMLVHCECVYVHMFMHVYVGVSILLVGDVLQSLLCQFLIVLRSCLPLCTINIIICA